MSDRSHRDCNVNSLFPFCNISVSPKWANRSHRVYLTNSVVSLLPKSVSSSLHNRYYWDCNVNSWFPFHNISVSPRWANRSHRVYLTNSLESLLPNRSHRVCVIGLTEISYALTLTISVLPSCMSVPTKILTVTRFAESVRPSLSIRSHRDWQVVCNG